MDLKSGNPALSVKTFDGLAESADPMTLRGTINKTAMLVAILLIGAGRSPVSFIHEGGTVGILFSLFVVGIASLNLVMDFDFIAKGVAQRSPKYMEWYSAFGLVVTLVWLYVEILRLFGKRR
jgi:uncharacterized YccA/Bax inhibitor family protein